MEKVRSQQRTGKARRKSHEFLASQLLASPQPSLAAIRLFVYRFRAVVGNAFVLLGNCTVGWDLVGRDVLPLLRCMIPSPCAFSRGRRISGAFLPGKPHTPVQEPRRQSQSQHVGQNGASILVYEAANCREDCKQHRTRYPMRGLIRRRKLVLAGCS
jgi:hypothetical protein